MPGFGSFGISCTPRVFLPPPWPCPSPPPLPAVYIYRTGTANTASIAITVCTSTICTSNIFSVCGQACELLLLPPPCSESDVDSGPHICPVVLPWAAKPFQGSVGDRIRLRICDLVFADTGPALPDQMECDPANAPICQRGVSEGASRSL